MNQKGFAAIVIAIIMVVVLGLTTVGFAQLMQREQRNALDRQLSNQAYYAAESGVNDATKAINSGFTVAKKTCDPLSDSNLPANIDSTSKTAAQNYLYKTDATHDSSIVNDSTGAKYTCLLIDPTPQTLEYTLSADKPRYTQLTGVDNSDPTAVKPIGALAISWEDSAGNTAYAPGPPNYKFKPVSDWTYAGMLKIGLTPLTLNGIDRAKLVSETYTAFLYPNATNSGDPNTSSYPTGTGAQGGLLVDGNCNTGNSPRDCSVKITGLNQESFLITLDPIYRASNVTIRAYGLDGTTPLRIKNAQTLVDSTGKAQDVLRRIQVRISAVPNYAIPEGTRATTALCKQLNLTPSSGTSGSQADCPLP